MLVDLKQIISWADIRQFTTSRKIWTFPAGLLICGCDLPNTILKSYRSLYEKNFTFLTGNCRFSYRNGYDHKLLPYGKQGDLTSRRCWPRSERSYGVGAIAAFEVTRLELEQRNFESDNVKNYWNTGKPY